MDITLRSLPVFYCIVSGLPWNTSSLCKPLLTTSPSQAWPFQLRMLHKITTKKKYVPHADLVAILARTRHHPDLASPYSTLTLSAQRFSQERRRSSACGGGGARDRPLISEPSDSVWHDPLTDRSGILRQHFWKPVIPSHASLWSLKFRTPRGEGPRVVKEDRRIIFPFE
jgi:hypothetical protein